MFAEHIKSLCACFGLVRFGFFILNAEILVAYFTVYHRSFVSFHAISFYFRNGEHFVLKLVCFYFYFTCMLYAILAAAAAVVVAIIVDVVVVVAAAALYLWLANVYIFIFIGVPFILLPIADVIHDGIYQYTLTSILQNELIYSNALEI